MSDTPPFLHVPDSKLRQTIREMLEDIRRQQEEEARRDAGEVER